MSQSVLHHGEIAVDPGLARALLRQFPAWAELPLQAVLSSGTDNVIYRLGDKLCARFPRYAAAAQQPLTDAEFLPRLAPHLPLAIPESLALGQPDEHYPFHWTVCRWIEGENARSSPPNDMEEAAATLADFVTALQNIDPAGGPPAGARNFERGLPLSVRDKRVRRCISQAEDLLDVPTVTALWERALAAPIRSGPPVWLHGDIHGSNIITRHGRICAIIDFGCLGIGDPACELSLAWSFLDAKGRAAFREQLSCEEADWLRGMGWALSVALIALPYYRHSSPDIAAASLRQIKEIMQDFGYSPRAPSPEPSARFP